MCWCSTGASRVRPSPPCFPQFVSGVGIGLYTLKQFPELCPRREDCKWDKHNLGTILNLSVMTSVQQSIMNFGILMVQGLVNSFGTVIMAAFAAAVKIDSFAYMPVQDFGNAFSTYVAQNYGANQSERIRKGIRSAAATSAVFCICISVLVCLVCSSAHTDFYGSVPDGDRCGGGALPPH